MKIDQLTLTNFKCFEQQTVNLHPQFTLFVGDNGSGKTSILDGLAVAAGSWLLGVDGHYSRPIRRHEVRFSAYPSERAAAAARDPGKIINGAGYQWEENFPCVVGARGSVLGQELSWKRALNGWPGRTTYREANALKALAQGLTKGARQRDVLLPLIAHYDICRLCGIPRDQGLIRDAEPLTDKTGMSRLTGYDLSIDQRLSTKEFVRWIARQSWIAFQQGGTRSDSFIAVQRAAASCIPGASGLHFDPMIGEVVIDLAGSSAQPFNNLSDGQRAMLALVGDLATKATMLNPHLGAAALDETPGIVLIDELDLHLHPKWQRRVAADLKRTFPSLQFVCTTHSPQIIGELSREEVRLLHDGRPQLPAVARGADSNWILDHVMEGAASETQQARDLKETVEDALDQADLPAARRHIEALRALLNGDASSLVELESYLDRLERLAEAPEDDEDDL